MKSFIAKPIVEVAADAVPIPAVSSEVVQSNVSDMTPAPPLPMRPPSHVAEPKPRKIRKLVSIGPAPPRPLPDAMATPLRSPESPTKAFSGALSQPSPIDAWETFPALKLIRAGWVAEDHWGFEEEPSLDESETETCDSDSRDLAPREIQIVRNDFARGLLGVVAPPKAERLPQTLKVQKLSSHALTRIMRGEEPNDCWKPWADKFRALNFSEQQKMLEESNIYVFSTADVIAETNHIHAFAERQTVPAPCSLCEVVPGEDYRLQEPAAPPRDANMIFPHMAPTLSACIPSAMAASRLSRELRAKIYKVAWNGARVKPLHLIRWDPTHATDTAPELMAAFAWKEDGGVYYTAGDPLDSPTYRWLLNASHSPADLYFRMQLALTPSQKFFPVFRGDPRLHICIKAHKECLNSLEVDVRDGQAEIGLEAAEIIGLISGTELTRLKAALARDISVAVPAFQFRAVLPTINMECVLCKGIRQKNPLWTVGIRDRFCRQQTDFRNLRYGFFAPQNIFRTTF